MLACVTEMVRCSWSKPADVAAREIIEAVLSESPEAVTDETVIEALKKCRERFHDYELHHLREAKVAGMHEYTDLEKARQEKAVRNREMVDLCDAALSKVSPLI